MNKNYYNIGLSRWVVLVLPKRLVKYPAVLAFLRALISPVTAIYRSLINYINQLDTSVNSQVCYMQKMLNDAYDYYDRRIIVRDAPISYNDYFLFDESTDKAVLLSDNVAVLWVDNEMLGTTNTDFEIVFPTGYTLSENEETAVKRMINDNKLASKKYNIVYG